MSSFMVELWESIFTPGPTPAILKAANVSFAALQLLLLVLLVATYSIHFLVLSVICGGLWASVNWFAAELAAVQAAEREKEREKDREEVDSDTEVDEGGKKIERERERRLDEKGVVGVTDVEPVEVVGSLKVRGDGAGFGTQSSVSTEDEWEKVSTDEQDKDK